MVARYDRLVVDVGGVEQRVDAALRRFGEGVDLCRTSAGRRDGDDDGRASFRRRRRRVGEAVGASRAHGAERSTPHVAGQRTLAIGSYTSTTGSCRRRRPPGRCTGGRCAGTGRLEQDRIFLAL